MSKEYAAFLSTKKRSGAMEGFKPTFALDALYPFQQFLVDWSVRKGKAAVFADCGL
jgi:hypothetical protein